MDKLQNFFYTNPHYFGLFFAGAGLFLLVGVILDWDWVMQRGEGAFDLLKLSHHFGRTTARVVMGILAGLCIACGVFYFVYYASLSPES